MHSDSASFLSSFFEQDNDDSARWRDEDDEPQCYVVGRPSLNREGVQDEATADFDDEEVA